jgi:hypothetical protein
MSPVRTQENGNCPFLLGLTYFLLGLTYFLLGLAHFLLGLAAPGLGAPHAAAVDIPKAGPV